MPSLRTVTRTPEVSLTLSPMMRSNRDWENWHVGLLPIAAGVLVLIVLLQLEILSWSAAPNARSPFGVGYDVSACRRVPNTLGRSEEC